MSQFAFGSGNMYVTQLQDAWGNLVANPTPVPLLTLQEGSIDLSGEIKKLYGQKQIAEAVARGKLDINFKVKPARIFAAVWNTIFFGQALTPGLFTNYTDTTGQVIPASTPYTITIAPPNSGAYVKDLGVISATGSPMARVASAPAVGQYMVNPATGVYTFASGQQGQTVFINYQYTVSGVQAGTAQTQTVRNLQMGAAPSFAVDLTVPYLGKLTTFSAPMAISNKMSIGFKNEDFSIPEFDFSVMDNGTGNVLTWSTSE